MTIDRRTYGQQAYAEIRTLIIDGTLAPGSKVIVRPLAERLQLSATPIKSALAALERDGFLTAIPHRGYFVPEVSVQDHRRPTRHRLHHTVETSSTSRDQNHQPPSPQGVVMTYSALSHLECSRTGDRYEADVVQGVSAAGVPLLARYDLARVAETVSPADIAGRQPNLWRYHEVLPVRDPENVVSMGEGMTPLIQLPRYGNIIGLPRLLMKDEGVIPTGTFKARGAAVGVSRAAELGVRGVAMPTNGNAGAAWAAYAARAGMRSLIAMPVGAPSITRAECAVAGAELYLVDGLIGDAGKLISAAVRRRGGYQEVSTLKEPYRLEGKKTMGYELAEQLGWRMPDVILYPAGGGVGLIGIHKAVNELRELGWIDEHKIPRLVAVQAVGCAPIVRAFETGADVSVPFPDAHTIAFGITVPKALGDFLVLDAVRSTNGTAVAVTDDEILAEQKKMAGKEGIFICPEGAACLAAARQLRESNWLSGADEVLILNTGMGLKYPETVNVDVPTLSIDAEIPLLPALRSGQP